MSIRSRRSARDALFVVVVTLLVASCGGDNSSNAQPQYTIGGSVRGLTGSGLVLQNNGGNDLAIAANGSFVFSGAVGSGSAYAVTAKSQPTNPSQTCVVAAASGTINGANVSNVAVTCSQAARFMYVSGHEGIYCFSIDAQTGVLTALASSPCVSGVMTGVAVDPAAMFAYATLNISGEVTAYAINSSTGDLTAIGSQLNGGGSNPVDITVDPSGHFVYMANYAGGISAFTINSDTGGLTAVSGSPFPTAPPVAPSFVAGVNSVTVDPTGKFVYAALNGGNDVSAYVIDSSNGALTSVVGSPFSAGTVAMAVRVDPSGRYAYVANLDSDNISAYVIDSSTGALTPIAGSPFPGGGGTPTGPPMQGPVGAGPTGLAIDPSGRFVYVTNANSNTISAFSIDTNTGALTPISGSPFASGVGPWGASVDPTGKFLYVTNDGEGTVSAYTIDGTTGSLTPISGSPFVASGNGTVGIYAIAFSN